MTYLNKIREAVGFDLVQAYLRGKSHQGIHGDPQFVKGVINKHKKLYPIIEALLEVAEAAESVAKLVPYSSVRPDYLEPLDAALDNLKRAVERE